MSKHTPKPWYWSDAYQTRDLSATWSLIGKGGFGILSCDGNGNSPPELNKYDGYLIAEAPELLDCLAETNKDLAVLRGNVFDAAKTNLKFEGMSDLIDQLIERNKAAIAKATGANNG
jgi:hypothetical protein